MGLRFFKSVSITAGQQFLGTELSTAPGKVGKLLIIREILLKMGSEAKAWEVRKVIQQNGGPVSFALLSETASTDTDVVIRGADADVLLMAGEQIQFVTTGATSEMEARVLYEELDNSPEQAFNDPKYTR